MSTTFVARAAVDAGVAATLGTRRRIVAVSGTRGLTRGDLVANIAVPEVLVSPDDGEVTLDGRVLSCEPVDEVRSPAATSWRERGRGGGRRTGRASEGQAAFSPTSSGMTINPYPAVPLPQAYTW